MRGVFYILYWNLKRETGFAWVFSQSSNSSYIYSRSMGVLNMCKKYNELPHKTEYTPHTFKHIVLESFL